MRPRSLPDWTKRLLIRVNRFPGTLERLEIVTNEDRLRLLGDEYRRPILTGQEGNDRIASLIAAGAPCMLSRVGLVELSCLRFFLRQRENGTPYGDKIRHALGNNAGFFPLDDGSLDRFAALYLDCLTDTDLLVTYLYRHEAEICNRFCPEAGLVHPTCLEPFWFTPPWSLALAGKKVLVVYPFADTIESQYRRKRRLLFASPEILPPFELRTLQAVQSIAGSPVGFASWFDAYRHMCEAMAGIDFDVCLIGAGAYGLPLASFAKGLGKQALHLGGLTQLLFGIKGKRWEELYADSIATLFNEHWVRPAPSDTPKNAGAVENGCYW